jgi:hypothetical protein
LTKAVELCHQVEEEGCDCKYGVAEGSRVSFAFWSARTNPKIEAFFLQNHIKWVASSTSVLLATNRSLLITALEVGACEGSVPLFRSYLILFSFFTSCWESSCIAGMNGKVTSCASSSGTPVELYTHTHIYIPSLWHLQALLSMQGFILRPLWL